MRRRGGRWLLTHTHLHRTRVESVVEERHTERIVILNRIVVRHALYYTPLPVTPPMHCLTSRPCGAARFIACH